MQLKASPQLDSSGNNRLSPPSLNTQISNPPNKQYSLTKILLIWFAVTLPNFMVMWVIVPSLISQVKISQGILFWILILACLGWQFVLSVWILHQESGTLRWATVKERLWLRKPIDPKTGKGSGLLFCGFCPACFSMAQ